MFRHEFSAPAFPAGAVVLFSSAFGADVFPGGARR
jgi:hypothetical protein